ncbi:hypothetical protein OA087_00350 [bacterium]|nr:hypothetical protein [bacterium]
MINDVGFEKKIINKINNLLLENEIYGKAKINSDGDIIIRKKIKTRKEPSILTNIFRKMISEDIKKTGSS